MAWVCLVMNGDRYIPGALVVAHSLNRVGTKHDIVCMVDSTVSQTGRDALASVFTRVVEVSRIEAKTRHMATKRQQALYSDWMSYSYTKWSCLNLTEYPVVAFLDADNVAQAPMDHLLEQSLDHYPAACFTPYVKNPNETGGLIIPYSLTPDLWAPVERAHIDQSLTKGGFVAAGSFVIIPTGRDLFSRYREFITRGDFAKLHQPLHTFSGADEVSITLFMLNEGYTWHYLPYEYTAVPRKLPFRPPGHRPIFMYSYTGTDKPWEHPKDKWPDFEFFYASVEDLLKTHSALTPWFPYMSELKKFEEAIGKLEPTLSAERRTTLAHMQYNREKYGLIYSREQTQELDHLIARLTPHGATITVVNGNILDFRETYMVHQTNCQTRYGKGLSEALFRRYPSANVYKDIDPSRRVPGSIVVRNRIISLFGQHAPGASRSSSDSKAQRLLWFKQGMNAIVDLMKPGESLAIPYGIGCGLAAGEWAAYEHIIHEAAERLPASCKIVIYQFKQ